jgi:undecaprenyl diphosphate synthase
MHVAIIMDGSGRWAEARGLTRLDGHRAGEQVVHRLLDVAPGLGIGTMTLFALSSDNWNRPRAEVEALMGLLRDFLADFHAPATPRSMRVDVIGRRDRLAADLRAAVDRAEATSADAQGLHLRLAIDYSGRDAIRRAVPRCTPRAVPDRDTFATALAAASHARHVAPDVDLLIRTGGEQRLSDFLLWECAYAELVFSKKMWPDFDVEDLRAAVDEFHARERRFGCLPSVRA